MATALEKSTTLIDCHLSISGKLIVNAANCDLLLYCAFKVVSGFSGKVANAIYFSTETIHTKKNIITRLLVVNADEKETEIVARIISGTEKATNQRNELSHSLMKSDGNRLVRVNPRHQGQAEKPVTKAFLDGLLKHSSAAYIAALRAYQELCLKRGIPPTISHE